MRLSSAVQPHTKGRVEQRTQGTGQPQAPVSSAPLVSRPHHQGSSTPPSTNGLTAAPVVRSQPATQQGTAPLVIQMLQRHQGYKTFLSHRRGGGGFRKWQRGGRWPYSYVGRFLQLRYAALLRYIENKVRKLWGWCNHGI